MKVKYIGRYHSGPSLCYKGVQFVEGESSEVGEEWYEINKGSKLKVEAKKTAKKTAKKVSDDGDSQ